MSDLPTTYTEAEALVPNGARFTQLGSFSLTRVKHAQTALESNDRSMAIQVTFEYDDQAAVEFLPDNTLRILSFNTDEDQLNVILGARGRHLKYVAGDGYWLDDELGLEHMLIEPDGDTRGILMNGEIREYSRSAMQRARVIMDDAERMAKLSEDQQGHVRTVYTLETFSGRV